MAGPMDGSDSYTTSYKRGSRLLNSQGVTVFGHSVLHKMDDTIIGNSADAGELRYHTDFINSRFATEPAISPGFACLPSLDFSNTGTSSTKTSKRPPRDASSSICAPGYFSFISAARLAARGS